METVQFIIHYIGKYSYLSSARMALKGGCRWIQLRMKGAGRGGVVSVAVELRNLYDDYGTIFIIDNHVELIGEIGANGVHLDKSDMSITEAWRILGDEYITGDAANVYEDVKKHWLNEVNYVGCGPFRCTITKQKLSPILRLEGYKEVIRKMREEKVYHLPIVAIGGVTFADIPVIMQTGVTGIILSETVLRIDSPVEKMRKMLTIINQTGSC